MKFGYVDKHEKRTPYTLEQARAWIKRNKPNLQDRIIINSSGDENSVWFVLATGSTALSIYDGELNDMVAFWREYLAPLNLRMDFHACYQYTAEAFRIRAQGTRPLALEALQVGMEVRFIGYREDAQNKLTPYFANGVISHINTADKYFNILLDGWVIKSFEGWAISGRTFTYDLDPERIRRLEQFGV